MSKQDTSGASKKMKAASRGNAGRGSSMARRGFETSDSRVTSRSASLAMKRGDVPIEGLFKRNQVIMSPTESEIQLAISYVVEPEPAVAEAQDKKAEKVKPPKPLQKKSTKDKDRRKDDEGSEESDRVKAKRKTKKKEEKPHKRAEHDVAGDLELEGREAEDDEVERSAEGSFDVSDVPTSGRAPSPSEEEDEDEEEPTKRKKKRTQEEDVEEELAKDKEKKKKKKEKKKDEEDGESDEESLKDKRKKKKKDKEEGDSDEESLKDKSKKKKKKKDKEEGDSDEESLKDKRKKKKKKDKEDGESDEESLKDKRKKKKKDKEGSEDDDEEGAKDKKKKEKLEKKEKEKKEKEKKDDSKRKKKQDVDEDELAGAVKQAAEPGEEDDRPPTTRGSLVFRGAFEEVEDYSQDSMRRFSRKKSHPERDLESERRHRLKSEVQSSEELEELAAQGAEGMEGQERLPTDEMPSATRLPVIDKGSRASTGPGALSKRGRKKRFLSGGIPSDYARVHLPPALCPRFQGWDMQRKLGPRTQKELPSEGQLAQQMLKYMVNREARLLPRISGYKHVTEEDPKEEGKIYAIKFGLKELFDFMTTCLVRERPDKPLDFLIAMTREMNRHNIIKAEAEQVIRGVQTSTASHLGVLLNRYVCSKISVPTLDNASVVERRESASSDSRSKEDSTTTSGATSTTTYSSVY